MLGKRYLKTELTEGLRDGFILIILVSKWAILWAIAPSDPKRLHKHVFPSQLNLLFIKGVVINYYFPPSMRNLQSHKIYMYDVHVRTA